MKNKRVLIISIIGILIMLLGIGITYAWFSSGMDGIGSIFKANTNELKLIYTDTLEISNISIEPGWSETKTFTVENTTDEIRFYKIIWKDLINTFVNSEDLTIKVESTDGGYNLSKTPIASSSTASNVDIIKGVAIEGNATHTYTVTLEYSTTYSDQSADVGKSLSGSIEIEALDTLTHRVTVLGTNGSVTPSETEVTHGEDVTLTLNPSSGYVYSSNTCGGTVNENVMTINSVISSKTCTVTFVENENLLYKKILSNNPTRSTRETFDVIYTESNNGDTIHEETFTQDETEYTTYYFAGAVTNNYVKFTNEDGSEMWWRIVRINEDNSVRLLYYGTDKEGSNMFPSTSQAFNTSYNNSIYVGYEYATDTQHGLEANSSIKDYLENWYTSNLASYDTYISRTAVYCNDRTVTSGTWSATESNTYYAGYTRLAANKTPTFECVNVSDRFTGSEVTGNGRLENKPIGLITADEVAYAGGLYGTNNTSYYISEKATGVTYWWTMTPYYWVISSYAHEFFIGGSSGTGYFSGGSVNDPFGVRPVISLKSCVLWSNGNGTSDSPYEVTIDNTCENAEN